MKTWIPRRTESADLDRRNLGELETLLLRGVDGVVTNLELISRSGHDAARAQQALYQLFVKGLISRGDAPDKTAPALNRDTWTEAPLDLLGEPVLEELVLEPDAAEVVPTVQLNGAREFEDCESVPTLQLSETEQRAALERERAGDAIGDEDSVRTVQVAEQDPGTSPDDVVTHPIGDDDSVRTIELTELESAEEPPAPVEAMGAPEGASDGGTTASPDEPAQEENDTLEGGLGSGDWGAAFVTTDGGSVGESRDKSLESPFAAPLTAVDGATEPARAGKDPDVFTSNSEVKTVRQRKGGGAASIFDTVPEDD